MDRRFGERDETLSHEEKMLARFQRERQVWIFPCCHVPNWFPFPFSRVQQTPHLCLLSAQVLVATFLLLFYMLSPTFLYLILFWTAVVHLLMFLQKRLTKGTLFNLEEEDLTHFGRSLSKDAPLDEYIPSDDEVQEEQTFNRGNCTNSFGCCMFSYHCWTFR